MRTQFTTTKLPRGRANVSNTGRLRRHARTTLGSSSGKVRSAGTCEPPWGERTKGSFGPDVTAQPFAGTSGWQLGPQRRTAPWGQEYTGRFLGSGGGHRTNTRSTILASP